ncbi:TetR/AcrR family transcriptional regulator [Pseudonocardia sp. CA-107938]|uniref:TetR/AcrR family transcriptional regulator n=1 Tax=Pseudonocardia sp. CA-107938 TaxID=3240021 RepID=UPI003D8BEAE4
MGNREDLLAGALTCLLEKGWARSTVRDIAAAAGVNHAAIGYHFGSREALLTEAFMQAFEEWGDEIGAAVAASVRVDANPRERYEAFWRQAIESFRTRPKLWMATVEASLQLDGVPRVREAIQRGMGEGRSGLAAGLLGVPEDELDPVAARRIGSVQLAMISGIMLQWLIDPDAAPGPEDIAEGLAALAAHVS